jgi:hypothetical protein
MRLRYSDYEAEVTGSFLLHQPRRHVLPNPFNLGEDWYGMAISAIISDVENFDSRRGWRRYWDKCQVFNNNRDTIELACYNVLLTYWAEWLEMMGL